MIKPVNMFLVTGVCGKVYCEVSVLSFQCVNFEKKKKDRDTGSLVQSTFIAFSKTICPTIYTTTEVLISFHVIVTITGGMECSSSLIPSLGWMPVHCSSVSSHRTR